jgi:hypothetical protein
MKTLEQKQKEAQEYIAKSAQHLFIVNDKIITKIISFTKDDKLQYAKLTIIGDRVSIDVVRTNQMKWDYKQTLFPQYVKTKSIPYFKKMKELVSMIEKEITLDDNKALIEKVKALTSTLELVKE